jgi:hypothetical protein
MLRRSAWGIDKGPFVSDSCPVLFLQLDPAR